MTGLDLIRTGLVAIGADGLVNQDTGCGCVLADLFPCGECGCQCAPAKIAPCDRSTCNGDHDEGMHLAPMGDELAGMKRKYQEQLECNKTLAKWLADATRRAERAEALLPRVLVEAVASGKRSKAIHLRVVLSEELIHAAKSQTAIIDHTLEEVREKLTKVCQELAATVECDCGTCLACRVADVVGA